MKKTTYKQICLYILTILITISLSVQSFPKVASAANCQASNVRWSFSSNTIYLSGPVTCTLTEIDSFLSSSVPLGLVDPINHVWFLGANLKLESGMTLALLGSAIGGDVDELRLKSNNSSVANSIIWIRAQWGTIQVENSKITSWDGVNNQPDSEYSTYKRSYIHVRSYLETDGLTTRESRMDISNSDIGYLGYNGAEAYGLAWKVSGSSPGLYDKVNVYGNVISSRLHHNYFGAYTYGAFGMLWQNNEIDYNVKYGLDPHDDSDGLIIENNLFHDNGNHGLICSKRCDNLTIRNNNSYNNTGNGIMLHRNTNDTLVENNTMTGNSDSGLAVFDSHNNTIRGNTSTNNKRGIRLSVGSSGNSIADNQFSNNQAYGIYAYKGSDVPTNGDGRPKNNRFINNRVQDNGSYPIKLSDSDDNLFEQNTLVGKNILMERSLRNSFVNNYLSETIFYDSRGSSSAGSLTNLSGQPTFNVKVDLYSTVTLFDPGGKIFDPEENSIATSVKPQGSEVLLNSGNITTTSRIVSRNFWVNIDEGSLTVNSSLWSSNKEWVSKSSNANLNVAYIVGDLTPGQSYRVQKNGQFLFPLLADTSGKITFDDLLVTTNPATYSILLD